MTIDQIEQWEQKNPDDIDKVPVQADIFYGRVVFRRKTAAQRFFDQPNEQARADEHVQGVEAGHDKVQREEKLGMGVGAGIGARLELEIQTGNVVLNIFVVILDGLDAKKDGAEDQSGDEEPGERFFPAGLRGPDSHGHGQAAANEDDSVDGAPGESDGFAGFTKNVRISGAVERVGHEQAAEEKNFGGQEDPHAQRGGFPLLLHRSILFVQFSGAMHAGLL